MKSIFPSIYSTLDPVALSSLISEQYELKDVQCTFLVRGVGDTYLVETAGERFILRVYRSSYRSLPQIKDEVDLLLALKDANVSVSYPFNDTILKIDAAEGERHAVLFTFAPGQAQRVLSEQQLLNLGREMARFHNVSAEIMLNGTRWNFDLDTTVFKPLEMIKLAEEDRKWLMEIAEKIKDKFSDISGISKGYCHFDFLPKNFHFENDKVTFFDFDFMGYGWLVNDVMTFWQHLVLDVLTGRMKKEDADIAYQTFIKGYREYREISDEELALVPYLAIGFWLFYMGFHTTHDQFYNVAQPSQVKAYMGVLKHIVEKYW
jgi:Ser/Thr protein kinase RdoA (MazF antagonist)